MRAIVQRVERASVSVEGTVTGAIDRGYLILLGVDGIVLALSGMGR